MAQLASLGPGVNDPSDGAAIAPSLTGWGLKLLEGVPPDPDTSSDEGGGDARSIQLSLKPIFRAGGRRALVSTAAWRYSFYSPEMNLLSETELRTTTGTPLVLYEYVWFNGHPVAQVDARTVTHWTFTDHLGTPSIQTSSDTSVYWRAEYEPYGKVFALRTGDQHQPLRLPGQEAEQLNLGLNGVTERSYNIFRWYRSGWGRYTQPDPIDWKVVSGQQRDLFQLSFELPPSSSGQSTFAYALDSPSRFRDPLGLSVADGPNPIGTIIQQKMECGRRMATYATQRSETLMNSPGFPGGRGGRHNGPGDAFRHCLWSCLMVQNCGGDTAFLAGWGHEIVQNHFWPPSESMMDASNNAQGRSCTECSSCETCCIAKMRTATLQLQP